MFLLNEHGSLKTVVSPLSGKLFTKSIRRSFALDVGRDSRDTVDRSVSIFHAGDVDDSRDSSYPMSHLHVLNDGAYVKSIINDVIPFKL